MPTIKSDGGSGPQWLRILLAPLKRILGALPLPLRRHLFYLRYFGTWGNFSTPKHFNEKMQWRILNDRRTWLIVACDKLASKAYAQRIAAERSIALRVPTTYWVGTDIRELYALRAELPTRWVLKPNHSSGRFRLVDSSDESIDWNDLIAAGDRWMRADEETQIRGHFGYTGARKLIIAEERIGSGTHLPAVRAKGSSLGVIDWGVSAAVHGIGIRRSFGYDAYLQRVQRHVGHAAQPSERSVIDELSPAGRKTLLAAAAALCEGFDSIRVDFFIDDDSVWFNEYTAYSASGLMRFDEERMALWSANWRLPDLERSDPREDLWRELLGREERGTLQS